MDEAYRQALRAIPFLSREQLEELSRAVADGFTALDLRDARASLPFRTWGGCTVESVRDPKRATQRYATFVRCETRCGKALHMRCDDIGIIGRAMNCRECESAGVDLRRQQERGGR